MGLGATASRTQPDFDWSSMNYLDVFEKIEKTASLKEKEAILVENKDNDKFRYLLRASLDPYRLFQFNKVPCKFSKDSDKLEEPFEEFTDLLRKLENRKITGNNAKDEVIRVLSLCEPKHFQLFGKILIKGSLGIGIKSVNKAYGKTFLPEFSLMLAPNEIPNITDIKYPVYVQPKLDGFRCVYIPSKGEVQLWSRQGKPFGNKNLSQYFEELASAGAWVLDGELYSHEVKFNNLISILNKEDAPIPKGLKFVVYDCIPEDDWKRQKCDISYEDRLRVLRSIVNSRIANYQKVTDIASDEVEQSVDVKNIYKKYLDKGYEGVMLKDPDGKYQWKRVTVNNGAMLKLKPFKSVDLKVIGTYEGEGNFSETIGGIVVDFGGCPVRVGSGFTMADREEISRDTKAVIGKTAEVKYFEETVDGSLRFPIFKRWRNDK